MPDRAVVVDFDYYSSLIRPLTGDFDAVNSSIDSLDAYGGTNIGAGMSTANSHLINSGDSKHAWMVILLTDGQGSYSDYYIQQAIANNITVYTIVLGSDVNSALLTNIATATGGQYFPLLLYRIRINYDKELKIICCCAPAYLHEDTELLT